MRVASPSSRRMCLVFFSKSTRSSFSSTSLLVFRTALSSGYLARSDLRWVFHPISRRLLSTPLLCLCATPAALSVDDSERQTDGAAFDWCLAIPTRLHLRPPLFAVFFPTPYVPVLFSRRLRPHWPARDVTVQLPTSWRDAGPERARFLLRPTLVEAVGSTKVGGAAFENGRSHGTVVKGNAAKKSTKQAREDRKRGFFEKKTKQRTGKERE